MRKQTHGDTGIHVEGLWELQRTLTKMGKDASEHVRVASTEIAEDFLHWVRGSTSTEAEAVAASMLRVYRDRVPKVGFPANRKVPVSGKPTISEFFYGTEFGGPSPFPNGGNRFREHTGQEGYFFYPTLRRRGPQMAVDWFEMIEDVMEKDWNAGAARARAGAD